MEKQIEALSTAVLANAQDIENLQERYAVLEEEVSNLRKQVRTAFAQAGTEFDKAGAFVSSRTPKLDVPLAAPTEPASINHHLRSAGSGLIGVPSGFAGDGGSLLVEKCSTTKEIQPTIDGR